MEGLEALIYKMSSTVCGGDENGSGTLAKVAGFNSFLEKAIQILDTFNSASSI